MTLNDSPAESLRNRLGILVTTLILLARCQDQSNRTGGDRSWGDRAMGISWSMMQSPQRSALWTDIHGLQGSEAAPRTPRWW